MRGRKLQVRLQVGPPRCSPKQSRVTCKMKKTITIASGPLDELGHQAIIDGTWTAADPIALGYANEDSKRFQDTTSILRKISAEKIDGPEYLEAASIGTRQSKWIVANHLLAPYKHRNTLPLTALTLATTIVQRASDEHQYHSF